MEPVIECENLSFAYKDTPVLTNVSFFVDDKEFIGLIGPNGGGKTTLLQLIMGFLEPNAGKIRVFGKTPEDAQQSIAYVPQAMKYDRNFPISVFEVVLSGRLSQLPWYGKFNQRDKNDAVDILNRMGLYDLRNHAFGTLSGGQAQRTLIARALISQPKLLLLDEPTANVDPQAEIEIYRIIQELKKEMTIVMVTHDLQTAIDQVERIFCVKNSVMVLKPEQVCEHFAMGLYHPPLLKEET